MSQFKSNYLAKKQANNPIVIWLLDQGYSYGTGARGEKGYVNTYTTCNGLYVVWVTFDFTKKVIYLYQEYNCGGMTREDTISLKEQWLESVDDFVDGVDDAVDDWLRD